MSRRLHLKADTVVARLWDEEERSGAPIELNGQFLRLDVDSPKQRVICAAFHPVEESCFVLGTAGGKAYGVSLRDNRLFLLASLEGPIRSCTFCPGYLLGPIVLLLSQDNTLSFVDWQRGTVQQRVIASNHKRAIQRLVTGPSTTPLIACVGEDVVTCWESAGAMEPLAHDGINLHATPIYKCVAKAYPTMCTLHLSGVPDSSVIAPKRDAASKELAHCFEDIHILHSSLLISVEASGIISSWHRPGVEAEESAMSGDVAPALLLQNSVAAPSSLRVRCSTACASFLVLGCEHLRTDDTRLPPAATMCESSSLVAFVEVETLQGAGLVYLPSLGPSPHVARVSMIREDMVACLMADGTVHMVLPSTFHLAFSVSPPHRTSAVSASPHRPQAKEPPLQWQFAASGPTFGAFWGGKDFVLMHLASAKESSESLEGGTGAPWISTIVERCTNTHLDAVSRSGKQWTSGKLKMAFTFLGKTAPTGQWDKSGDTSHSALNDTPPPSDSLNISAVRAALLSISEGHKAMKLVDKDVHFHWVNPTEKTHTTSNGVGADAMGTNGGLFCNELDYVSCAYNVRTLRSHLAKYGAFPHKHRAAVWRFLLALPHPSRCASQFAAVARRPPHVCLQSILAPYPLAEGPVRCTVEQALSCLLGIAPVLTLASYLPAVVYPFIAVFGDDVQSIVETVLVFFLNWGAGFLEYHPHGPPAALGFLEQILPQIDLPLHEHLDAIGCGVEQWGWSLMTTLYTDVTTGAEWLQLMDHAVAMPPAWLFCFHGMLLHHHLRAALLKCTSSDEAKEVLCRVPDASEVDGAAVQLSGNLSSSSFLVALAGAHRLFSQYAGRGQGDVRPLPEYMIFHTFSPSFEYPTVFAHDPLVLGDRMRQISRLQQEVEEEARAKERFARLQAEAKEAAEREIRLVRQQRARMAAKYESSAIALGVQEKLDAARAERECAEEELRMLVLRLRTSTAEELAAVQDEMNVMESELRHDLVDRHLQTARWDLSARLTQDELTRLEHNVGGFMEEAMQQVEGAAVEDLCIYPSQEDGHLVIVEREDMEEEANVPECSADAAAEAETELSKSGSDEVNQGLSSQDVKAEERDLPVFPEAAGEDEEPGLHLESAAPLLREGIVSVATHEPTEKEYRSAPYAAESSSEEYLPATEGSPLLTRPAAHFSAGHRHRSVAKRSPAGPTTSDLADANNGTTLQQYFMELQQAAAVRSGLPDIEQYLCRVRYPGPTYRASDHLRDYLEQAQTRQGERKLRRRAADLLFSSSGSKTTESSSSMRSRPLPTESNSDFTSPDVGSEGSLFTPTSSSYGTGRASSTGPLFDNLRPADSAVNARAARSRWYDSIIRTSSLTAESTSFTSSSTSSPSTK